MTGIDFFVAQDADQELRGQIVGGRSQADTEHHGTRRHGQRSLKRTGQLFPLRAQPTPHARLIEDGASRRSPREPSPLSADGADDRSDDVAYPDLLFSADGAGF